MADGKAGGGTSGVVGKTIVGVRAMTAAEMAAEGWNGQAGVVLLVEGRIKLYASRDPEGNGPGAMFGTGPGGSFMLCPVTPEAGGGKEKAKTKKTKTTKRD